MYKCKIKNGYIYSIDIKISNYKFTFFPMVYLKFFGDKSFNLEIGWGTFFIEIVKVKNRNIDDIKNLKEYYGI